MTPTLVLFLVGPALVALFANAIAAWRVGTRDEVRTIVLGWIFSSLLFDAFLSGPDANRKPAGYAISFIFYLWPFLRFGRDLRKEARAGTLSLKSAAPIVLVATVNVLIIGMLAFASACGEGVWQSGCAEMSATLDKWDP